MGLRGFCKSRKRIRKNVGFWLKHRDKYDKMNQIEKIERFHKIEGGREG